MKLKKTVIIATTALTLASLAAATLFIHKKYLAN